VLVIINLVLQAHLFKVEVSMHSMYPNMDLEVALEVELVEE
jgi:hypothetical protein